MYLRFQMQAPGTVEQVSNEHLYDGASSYPAFSVSLVKRCRSLGLSLALGQIYIFINDADDRVVECILISGLWS